MCYLDKLKEDGSFYRELPKNMRMDRELALIAASAKTNPLSYIPQYFVKDKEVILAIIKNKPEAIMAVHKELLNCKSFIMEVVYINGLILKYLSEEMKDDFNIAYVAVKQNKNAYNMISMRLKSNTVICSLL